jgi:hypothetical protein
MHRFLAFMRIAAVAQAVETLAASKADRTVLPVAQLMLAIRDGTWKPAR